MSGRFHLKDFGQTIGLEDAVAYLNGRGWQARREEQRGQIWFESPPDNQGDSIHQYLPISEEYADYDARLEDLVKALTVFEGRPAMDVISDMATAAGHRDRSDRVQPVVTVEEVIMEELKQMGGVVSWETVRERMEQLPIQIADIDLEIGGSSVFPSELAAVTRGTALLAAALGNVLSPSSENGLFLWRVCARIMEWANLELRWVPSQQDEFFGLARSAETDDPESLFEWLSENATPTRQHQRRKTPKK